jgi:outer membrane immunogenic protein
MPQSSTIADNYQQAPSPSLAESVNSHRTALWSGGIMRRILLAAAAVVISSSFASAADLPARPVYKAPVAAPVPYTWSGCYLGGNVGGGWTHDQWQQTGSPPFADNKVSGAVGGGQFGCDYQFSSFVVGIRGLFDWSGVKGTGPDLLAPSFTEHTTVSSFGLATARLGVLAQPNLLLYVDGGFARTKYKRFETDSTGAFQWSMNNNPSGWVVGGGAEWMFMPNWSLFVEYDHIDIATKTLSNSNSSIFNVKDKLDIVMVGANYHFNWGKAPVVAKY